MNTPRARIESYAAAAAQKTAMGFWQTLVAAMLAGAFIGLAAVGTTVAGATVASGSLSRLVGACVFPAGLAMVLLAGSELFTGNNLLLIPFLQKKITLRAILRNWGIVYLGNLLGALLVSVLAVQSDVLTAFDGAAAAAAVAAGTAKVSLGFWQALLRGVLCNFLVCIAVWMSLGAESAAGKLAAMYLPIALFVLCGFEHSVANMYYIPAALLAAGRYGLPAGALSWGSFFTANLLPVTLGNLVGGCGFVGAAYWFLYGRKTA